MGFRAIGIDWHIDPLRDVILGVEHGLEQVRARRDEEDWFDGNFVMDHSEWLLGVAFVAAQAYLDQAVGDVERHLRANGSSKADNLRAECLANDVRLEPSQVTRVELINAAANYYKHCGGIVGLRQGTVETLSKAGINLEDVYAYPCANVAAQLCGRELHLQTLCDIVEDWRVRIVAEFARVSSSGADSRPPAKQDPARRDSESG